ncbi:hypothetical protein MKW98_028365 [Papaver atlanticum]|uniref:Uncharacterized protein n=1 Tax=Papaver atlanticum TaxID=357466 RepID=A0AAD4XKG1_9MAGN|nr:hypothetical protein MKW98_028365 [Papaver atlanticum]
MARRLWLLAVKKKEGNALFKGLGCKIHRVPFSLQRRGEKHLRSACKLKFKSYKEAKKLCTKVLEIERRNVKALYGPAQAYINLVDFDLAEFDIKKALEIDPTNRDIICAHVFSIDQVAAFAIYQGLFTDH